MGPINMQNIQKNSDIRKKQSLKKEKERSPTVSKKPQFAKKVSPKPSSPRKITKPLNPIKILFKQH